ncbi:hypothetical protein KIPB_013963, partial [Kipferlia bialata]
DSVYTDEGAARAMYTHLAHTLKTHYLDKQTPEAQTEMRAKGDTLQCLPAERYFEEVWGGMCLSETEQ